MATTMTLTALILAIRQRADMVGSLFCTDAEITSYINQSYFELYDILIQAFGEDYYTSTPYTFTTDGINELFAFPADFYKLLGVDIRLTGSSPNSNVSLKRFNMSDRNRGAALNAPNSGTLTRPRYRPSGNNLWLKPLPSAGQTVTLYYAPRMTQLATGTDTVDGVSGWTEYIICDGAIKCLQKEESDVSVLMAQKAALLKRISEAASDRDVSMPATVSDVRNDDYVDGWGQNTWNGFD